MPLIIIIIIIIITQCGGSGGGSGGSSKNSNDNKTCRASLLHCHHGQPGLTTNGFSSMYFIQGVYNSWNSRKSPGIEIDPGNTGNLWEFS